MLFLINSVVPGHGTGILTFSTYLRGHCGGIVGLLYQSIKKASKVSFECLDSFKMFARSIRDRDSM